MKKTIKEKEKTIESLDNLEQMVHNEEEIESIDEESLEKYKNIDEKTIKEKNKEINNKAKIYLEDKNKLSKLIEEAEKKAKDKKIKNGFVEETWAALKNMFELVKAYIILKEKHK